MRLLLSEISSWMHAKRPEEDVSFSGISIDSRTVNQGDLFVALRGENFDGHRFLQDAKKKGASAFMIEEGSVDRSRGMALPSVWVKDTRAALGQLARYLRERFLGTVIGITGSNGKTTVKELVAHILKRKYRVLSTRGNFNNDIGVPLTLFGLMKQDYDVAVIEMGTNHPGEIAALTAIVQPDIATITHIGLAHMEKFGRVDNVLKEKAQIFNGLKDKAGEDGGYAIIHADSKYYPYLAERLKHKKMIAFGCSERAAVRLKGVDQQGKEPNLSNQISRFSVEINGREAVLETPLLGAHNLNNIQAAIATVLPLRMNIEDIHAAVASFFGVTGRLQIKQGIGGSVLIDDTYNANIDSLKSAIDVLRTFKGRKILVLGEMKELGSHAIDLHQEAGHYARLQGVDALLGYGRDVRHACTAFGASAQYFESVQSLVECIVRDCPLDADVAFLIKGSRSSNMDVVVSALQEVIECC